MTIIIHSAKCMERQTRHAWALAEQRLGWPARCPTCEGTGAVYIGTFHGKREYDPCPGCMGTCPRCGLAMPDRDGCKACGWTSNDHNPAVPPLECECDESEEE